MSVYFLPQSQKPPQARDANLGSVFLRSGEHSIMLEDRLRPFQLDSDVTEDETICMYAKGITLRRSKDHSLILNYPGLPFITEQEFERQVKLTPVCPLRFTSVAWPLCFCRV